MIEAPLFLGIDTSNYTTSLSVCDGNGTVLINEKKLLPVAEGERGLRQSDAVFAHIKNLPVLYSRIQDTLKDQNFPSRIAAVGYSARPRDAVDSYMPCFLVGQALAESFLPFHQVPVFDFSHQCGHVEAAVYSSGFPEDRNDFYAFHVSGGTTELLKVYRSPSGMSVDCLGGSADLHAGQLIDRVGVLLGASFPCGPELEKWALAYSGPRPKVNISVHDLLFHLSGVENQCLQRIRQNQTKEEIAAYVLAFISDSLSALTERIREREYLPVIFAGGVMSNSIVKKDITSRFKDIYFAQPSYSSDNAAGIARLTWKSYSERIL